MNLTKRQRSVILTFLVSFFPNLILIFLGFIKTQLIISQLGSEVNGLYQVIIQFSSFVMLANLGLDSIYRVTYYKFIEEKDYKSVSEIYNYSRKYFKLVTFVMIILTVILSLYLPTFVGQKTNVILLILAMAFFCIPCIIDCFSGSEIALLGSRQRAYIYKSIYNVDYTIRLIISIVILSKFKNFYLFILTDSIIYSFFRLLSYMLIKRDNNKILTEESYTLKKPLKIGKYLIFNKVNRLVFSNTDTLILSKTTGLYTVSIYNSYIYIINALISILSSISDSFLNALGSLLNSKEKYAEYVVKQVLIFISFLGVCIIPNIFLGMNAFVYRVWLQNDLYKLTIFLETAYTFYFIIYILRTPLEVLENSYGLYKETYKINLIEALLNLSISLFLVTKLKMLGIILGSVIAMCFSLIAKEIVVLRKLQFDYVDFAKVLIKILVIICTELILVAIIKQYLIMNDVLVWIFVMTITVLLSTIVNFIIFTFTFQEFRDIFNMCINFVKNKSLTKEES